MDKNDARSIRPRVASFLKTAIRRVFAMGLSWSLLGCVMGFNSESLWERDYIALAANVIAWMIVMGFVGTFMSAFGGRPRECWVGAGAGALITLACGIEFSGADMSFAQSINFGALLGALVAGTCWPWVRLIIALGVRVRHMFVAANG